LFSPAALARITEFAAGIPRNINSLCFNSMSLGCALQQKVMDSAIVEEVISDLDISRHTTKAFRGPSDFGPGAAQVYESLPAGTFAPASGHSTSGHRMNGGHSSHLSPSEARAYMEQIVMQLQKSSQLVTEALSDRTKVSGRGKLD
jgi:hypothetical protein